MTAPAGGFAALPETMWVIDGNNVMGSAADGWWRDRRGAAFRLASDIALWARGHEDDVQVVFDGRADSRVLELAGGNLQIRYSGSSARDSADDVIVSEIHALTEAGATSQLIVATSDRGLRGRIPDSVEVIGGGRFLAMVRPTQPPDRSRHRH